MTIAAKALAYWTPERLTKLTNNKRLLLLPQESAELLRALHIMNADASISADATRKYLQVNHMLQALMPTLEDLRARHKIINITDLGCGNSYLSLVTAWYLKFRLQHDVRLIGVDSNARLIASSAERALKSGLETQCTFETVAIDQYKPTERVHLIIALHACDTATDDALKVAIESEADYFALAPCCQAELAQKWSELTQLKDHPHLPLFQAPNLRRETAAHYTDLMRMLIARARGYQVVASKFTDSQHTNKNRLLLGTRRGRFLQEARDQYFSLKTAMGDAGIKSEQLLTLD